MDFTLEIKSIIEDIKYIRQATMLSEQSVKKMWNSYPHLSKEELIKLIKDEQSTIRILYS